MIRISVNLRFSLNTLFESEVWNGETVVSFLRTCDFGEGTFLMYIDTRKCTDFLYSELPGLNAGDVIRGQISYLGRRSCSKPAAKLQHVTR